MSIALTRTIVDRGQGYLDPRVCRKPSRSTVDGSDVSTLKMSVGSDIRILRYRRTPESQWISQTEFQVTGGDRGGGNMQIWYVQEGHQTVGSSSIYTVGKFDGLAIVVDPYGGKVCVKLVLTRCADTLRADQYVVS